MPHPPELMLQDYADGLLDEAQQSSLGYHLRYCDECARKLHALRRIEVALKKLQLEQTDEHFTDLVMSRLHSERLHRLGWIPRPYLVPLLSLVSVLILYFVFLFSSGAAQRSGLQAHGYTRMVGENLREVITNCLTVLYGWGGRYFSFAFGRDAYGPTIFLLLFLAGFALVDKYFFFPIIKKRISDTSS